MTKADYAGEFRNEVCFGKCCILWRPHGDCSGPLDAAHWVPAQFLRKRFGDDEEGWQVVYDPRSARPLCRKHHHQTDNGFIQVFREDIPSTCWEWAAEHQIDWRLIRDYGLRGIGVKA